MPETFGMGPERAARALLIPIFVLFRPQGAKAAQHLLLFPATRPETLVTGVTIFTVVGMALYGAAVG